MATSPIYGWPEPDNSSLVKNGAQDMRALGDAIDTTMATMQPKASNYAAGKNKIINGDFGIWQRGTTFNSASTGTYFADRFTCYVAGGTHNITRQTFTPGTAPVAGYEGQYFLRWTAASAGNIALTNKIENVQTFAGQTVKLSFWAKADAAINITTAIYQAFGSGGSSATVNTSGSQAITTSWARYTFTFNIASISGKTIGTGSYLQVDINLPNSTFVFDTWGWQLEAGSIETAFQTATGTIQGELAAASRYYQVLASGTQKFLAPASVYTAGQLDIMITYPEMRIAPSLVATSGTGYYLLIRNGGSDAFNSITLNGYTTPRGAALYNNTEISSTAGNAGWVYLDNASASVALNAEL